MAAVMSSTIKVEESGVAEEKMKKNIVIVEDGLIIVLQ